MIAPGLMNTTTDVCTHTGSEFPFTWGAEPSSTTFETIIGTPQEDACLWQQQTTPFTCAVVAQRGIIEAFTGETLSEAQLVYEATANGWLTDGGMSPLDASQLLELHGISCHIQTGATVEQLLAELTQGHKVIAGVDAGELWRQDSPLEDSFCQVTDHAIWVTGVDMSNPTHPQIFVNDSGDPAGAGKAYDLTNFVDAWQDSGFFYVATDHAPPYMQPITQVLDPAL